MNKNNKNNTGFFSSQGELFGMCGYQAPCGGGNNSMRLCNYDSRARSEQRRDEGEFVIRDEDLHQDKNNQKNL